MTLLRVSSVAAVTHPAGRAPGEELRVSLDCKRGCLWESFSFLPQTHRVITFLLSESHGFSHRSVLGPLIIVEPSDSEVDDVPQVSVTRADYQVFMRGLGCCVQQQT